MVGVSWYVVVANGGRPPGGDMLGHAAAAEWLRTLPWWDWRGWSDWFYGGQAIGVNYPPLGHAWMRFTHPVHGQMAAVAIGLLVLLPWGALRLARAIGCTPNTQRGAVAGVLVLTAAAGPMQWLLPSFHQQNAFFGSWPAMVSATLGLFAAAWAAGPSRPLVAGIVVGLAALLNPTVIPGVAIVCAMLLATSGVALGTAIRWAVTAGCSALSLSAWWLVPFVLGTRRIVRWEIPLSTAWEAGGVWQAVLLAILSLAASWAAVHGPAPFKRLAAASVVGLMATVVADFLGYLRPERWLAVPILLGAMAASGLFTIPSSDGSNRYVRPVSYLLGGAFLCLFIFSTARPEALPLAIWLLWPRPREAWAWGAALAWAAIVISVPIWTQLRSPPSTGPILAGPMEAVALRAGPNAEGLVFVDSLYNTASGDLRVCEWGYPWVTTKETGGRIRPLLGTYGGTGANVEFLNAEVNLRLQQFDGISGSRPHWLDAWQNAGAPSLDTHTRAVALGVRWYAECDADDSISIVDLPGRMAEGVSVEIHTSEEGWHRAATEWWVVLGSEDSSLVRATALAHVVPTLLAEEHAIRGYPVNQPAQGVSLRTDDDHLTVQALAEGWAWLKVPWDPYWQSVEGTPVLKGGPGHLVVWARQGDTELRWSVPRAVDATAAAVTSSAVLATVGLGLVGRRRGWDNDLTRPMPGARAFNSFADTVDAWMLAGTQSIRRAAARGRSK